MAFGAEFELGKVSEMENRFKMNIPRDHRSSHFSACFIYAAVFLFYALYWPARAIADQRCEIDSKVIHGVFLGVTDELQCTNTLANQMLYLSLSTSNRPAVIWYPITPEYAFRVELLDANGVAVSKTRLGETVGKRFLDFDKFAKQNGIPVLITSIEKGKSCGDIPLFRPVDFFNVERPGSYKLRIQFQVVVFPDAKRVATNMICIRYPYLVYPIVVAPPTK